MVSADEFIALSQSIEARQAALVTIRTQIAKLTTQLTENRILADELSHLEDSAQLYKAVGPVLLGQDLPTVRRSVNDRVAHIEAAHKKANDEHEAAMAALTAEFERFKTLQNAIKKAVDRANAGEALDEETAAMVRSFMEAQQMQK